jgi:mannan endo-1,4-beta-mannosidase
MGIKRIILICASSALAATIVAVGVSNGVRRAADAVPPPPKASYASLSTAPGQYLGIYASGVPETSAGIKSFDKSTGANVNIVMYYSAWNEPFDTSFASSMSQQGITPLVQIEPDKVNLAGIAKGEYDQYLLSYASAIRFYGRPIIIGFGHEMNGSWYPWGYRHASPAAFVAAWRHIVDIFRSAGAYNVTWLWTVNAVVSDSLKVANPDAWWPGGNYVTWVGVDGYYYHSSQTFWTLFASAIVDIRRVTSEPIIIAETGAAPQAGKAARITDLFQGVKAGGLLGLVWFDAIGNEDWRIENNASAAAAFGKAAETYP